MDAQIVFGSGGRQIHELLIKHRVGERIIRAEDYHRVVFESFRIRNPNQYRHYVDFRAINELLESGRIDESLRFVGS